MLLAETFRRNVVSVHDNVDTSIVQAALNEVTDSSVEVRAENADVVVLLIHHAADHQILKTEKGTSHEIARGPSRKTE